MAKYSAVLLFPPTDPVGVSGLACPPGLDLIGKGGSKESDTVPPASASTGSVAGVKNVKWIVGPGFGRIHGI